MIRKPRAEELRENKAVTVLREGRKIAVEGGKGVREGVAKIYFCWFAAIMGFGLLIPGLTMRGGSALWLLLGAGLAYAVYRIDKPRPLSDNPIVRIFAGRAAAEEEPSPSPATAPSVSQSGQLHFDISALTRQAVTLLVPGLFLIFLFGLGLSTPFMLIGISLVALAVLLAVRLFSDRLAMRYDPRSITVVGLLGSAELMWADVGDIHVKTFSHFNLKVLFSSGARRNLIILAQRNRLGGPAQLLIPIDLLGLDRQQLTGLVADLLCCRAAGGEVVPSWQREPPPCRRGWLERKRRRRARGKASIPTRSWPATSPSENSLLPRADPPAPTAACWCLAGSAARAFEPVVMRMLMPVLTERLAAPGTGKAA